MKQKAKKYINSLYIDYGDLNYKAEEQIKQAFIDGMSQQLILSGVVKSLPTKEEINLAANEFSDINEIICEDEYWVIAKNDGFQEGADFVINKLK